MRNRDRDCRPYQKLPYIYRKQPWHQRKVRVPLPMLIIYGCLLAYLIYEVSIHN